MRILLLILSLGIFIGFLCSSFTKKEKPWNDGFKVPGIVFLDNETGIDQTEVTNFHWREYQYWLSRTYGKESDEYKSALVDSSLWLELHNDHYLMSHDFYSNHPAFNNYPVVCVSYEQVERYCKWRNNVVFTYYLIRKGEITWDQVVNRKGDSIITVEKYKLGTIPGLKRNPEINTFPNYHLPTKAEIAKAEKYITKITSEKSKRKIKSLATIIDEENDGRYPKPVNADKHRKNNYWIFQFETNVSEWIAGGQEVYGQNWLGFTTDPLSYSGFETTKAHPAIGFRCAFNWVR